MSNTDFSRIITDLTSKGEDGRKIMTLKSLQYHTGISANVLSLMRRGVGAEPRYSDGVKLKQLHEEKCRHGSQA